VETLKLGVSPRFLPFTICLVLTLIFGALILTGEASYSVLIAPFFIVAALTAIGIHDIFQTKRAILRNYPIAGHTRYIMEDLRPKIRQYFFEGEKDGRPFPRDKRSLAYQRAKGSTGQAAVRHRIRRLRAALRVDFAFAGADPYRQP